MLSIETGGHRRGIRGAKESTIDIEGDATSLAERGFLKIARIGANDRGTNGDNVQGEWPARHIDGRIAGGDRKSTRLNSSHITISYAVFCLKKKKVEARSCPS